MRIQVLHFQSPTTRHLPDFRVVFIAALFPSLPTPTLPPPSRDAEHVTPYPRARARVFVTTSEQRSVDGEEGEAQNGKERPCTYPSDSRQRQRATAAGTPRSATDITLMPACAWEVSLTDGTGGKEMERWMTTSKREEVMPNCCGGAVAQQSWRLHGVGCGLNRLASKAR